MFKTSKRLKLCNAHRFWNNVFRYSHVGGDVIFSEFAYIYNKKVVTLQTKYEYEREYDKKV